MKVLLAVSFQTKAALGTDGFAFGKTVRTAHVCQGVSFGPPIIEKTVLGTYASMSSRMSQVH
jgi:hypothetical protein